MFRLHNASTLVVRARVACNFRVYGDPVGYHPAYDGTDLWILFPQQVSQGWFEIEPLLQAKGKSVTGMMLEHSPMNSEQQLTIFLELEFWDELGGHRKLPGRPTISISVGLDSAPDGGLQSSKKAVRSIHGNLWLIEAV
jgi:hypothetical protein